MITEIDRIIGGLEILKKYKPDASIYGKSNATSLLETQELEYENMSASDKEQLHQLGWRLKHNGYLWIMLPQSAINSER